jgi:hypothetical protein
MGGIGQRLALKLVNSVLIPINAVAIAGALVVKDGLDPQVT